MSNTPGKRVWFAEVLELEIPLTTLDDTGKPANPFFV